MGWRYMRSSEKESSMGFPEGFTLSAWLTRDSTRDVQGFEICRLDLLEQLFPPSEILRITDVARAAGASSENIVMESLVQAISARQHHRGRLIKHLSPSDPPTHGPLTAFRPHGGNGGQSSPAVGSTPTISLLWSYKHISPVCDGARERRNVLACVRFKFLTLKLLWVFLPRAGFHRYLSAVSSTSATRSASLSPTLLCWGTHELMRTLLTAPVERLTTMVKRSITDRRAVLRRDQRALLGRLRDRIINSKTQLRYERAVVRFFSFHRARRASPMCTNSWFDPLHFDLAQCSFIESLWEEGDSNNEAIDCVSGMLHYLPQLKGKVPGSKRLLVAWRKCELPARASPLNTFFLAALAGKAVALNDRRLSVSLLLGFHCMLRTGELLKIRKIDLSLMERHSRGIVVLHEHKSGASGFPRGMLSRRFSCQVCKTRARSWTTKM